MASPKEKGSSTDVMYTVGQLAKKMEVTPRTIQYYDKEGLLKPDAKSEGGRRLYSKEGFVRLYQIVSLKELGFSLDEIRAHLTQLDTPEGVANMLQDQAKNLEAKVYELENQKRILKALEVEVMKRSDVDFARYADIIANLRMGNELYWAVTHFDRETLDYMRSSIDQIEADELVLAMSSMTKEAQRMFDSGVDPEGPEAMALAELWWATSMKIVDNDVSLLGKMGGYVKDALGAHPDLLESQTRALEFIGPALALYVAQAAESGELGEEVLAQLMHLDKEGDKIL